MKASLPALLALMLSFLGLAIANEADAPTPASAAPDTSTTAPRIPDSLPPAAHLPGLNSALRVGSAVAAFSTNGTTGTSGTR
ncbi:hypothetical protein [Azotobacter armeniacus]